MVDAGCRVDWWLCGCCWSFASGVLGGRVIVMAECGHGDCMMNLTRNAEWLVMVVAVGQDERGVSDVVGGHLKVVDV